MEDNIELEFLREFFNEADCYNIDEELKQRILEIQKKKKLKIKIMYIKSCLSVGDEKEFMEILKGLGYGK